jgi:hypothetical protein
MLEMPSYPTPLGSALIEVKARALHFADAPLSYRGVSDP